MINVDLIKRNNRKREQLGDRSLETIIKDDKRDTEFIVEHNIKVESSKMFINSTEWKVAHTAKMGDRTRIYMHPKDFKTYKYMYNVEENNKKYVFAVLDVFHNANADYSIYVNKRDRLQITHKVSDLTKHFLNSVLAHAKDF